ncbi:hypothetical protein LCGC14_2467490, partial [marine sediment metagenome]
MTPAHSFAGAGPDAPYADYLKGLSFYEQISDVTRDQKMTRLALSTLTELVARFPNSKYARDAKLKIDLTHDHLAGKEMEIGRYYLRRDHYTAAINRFRVVVEDFQTTTHTAEALHRLVESYLSLGLDKEAQTAGAILGHNYRGSEWYEDSYKLLTGRGLAPGRLNGTRLITLFPTGVGGGDDDVAWIEARRNRLGT